MTILAFGLLLFFAVHLVPYRPAIRGMLVRRLGDSGYKIGFSLLSMSGLALIIYGKAIANYIYLWSPVWPGILRHLTYAFSLLFFILLMAMLIPCNLRRRLHHPFLLGIAFWSWGHLIVNGDLASMLLFGSFGLFAIFAVVSALKQEKLCTLPPQANWRDALVVALGALLYAICVRFHGELFGAYLV
ncbi:NnrU family protein [Corallincola luteus]|uniref:NnrU family protein n=1 Tax=Corallincola luteus TaxID=1775177 RepID=A0ABY2AN67_9GAMM|nr:NnrU family protein [Corallincola luteus]TCI04615.1 NnrU family protein [Corallincola luteus]